MSRWGGWLTSSKEGRKKERGRESKTGENCAGRKDALVAAASDSISMNFTADAAAAVEAAPLSESPGKPKAAPCVGAPQRGPATAPRLPPAIQLGV